MFCWNEVETPSTATRVQSTLATQRSMKAGAPRRASSSVSSSAAE
jgi:hypothetical protein